MDNFENDNEAFKALAMHFVQKEIDYVFHQLECTIQSKSNCLNFLDDACLETNCELQ